MKEEVHWQYSSRDDLPGTLINEPGQGGPPPSTIADGSISIDLDNIVYVPCATDDEQCYHVLSREEFVEIVSELERIHGYQKAVEDVIKRIKTWKANGSGTAAAHIHEKLLQRIFGIRKQPRDTITGSESPNEPTESEEAFLRDLTGLSNEYVEYHHDDELTVYRGYGYGLAEIGADLFENPTSESFNLNSSVVTNFTLSERVALEYGVLIFELNIEPSDIALATDHLLWHKSEEKKFTDAEVQVRGDKLREAPRESLWAPNTSRPILNLIEQIPTEKDIDTAAVTDDLGFTREDHLVLAGIVDAIDNHEKKLYSNEAKTRVYNWFKIFSHQIADTNQRDQSAEITPESLTDAVKQITGNVPPLEGRGIKRVL